MLYGRVICACGPFIGRNLLPGMQQLLAETLPHGCAKPGPSVAWIPLTRMSDQHMCKCWHRQQRLSLMMLTARPAMTLLESTSCACFVSTV